MTHSSSGHLDTLLTPSAWTTTHKESKSMMRPVPPGEVLQEQLEELNMSASKLAAHLDVPTNRITEILNGERALSADTALRLSRFFGTTPEFWMALQSSYELRRAELEATRPLERVTPLWQLKSPQREYVLNRKRSVPEALSSPARVKKKAGGKPAKRARKA